jgi:hypothetical protein
VWVPGRPFRHPVSGSRDQPPSSGRTLDAQVSAAMKDHFARPLVRFIDLLHGVVTPRFKGWTCSSGRPAECRARLSSATAATGAAVNDPASTAVQRLFLRTAPPPTQVVTNSTTLKSASPANATPCGNPSVKVSRPFRRDRSAPLPPVASSPTPVHAAPCGSATDVVGPALPSRTKTSVAVTLLAGGQVVDSVGVAVDGAVVTAASSRVAGAIFGPFQRRSRPVADHDLGK